MSISMSSIVEIAQWIFLILRLMLSAADSTVTPALIQVNVPCV